MYSMRIFAVCVFYCEGSDGRRCESKDRWYVGSGRSEEKSSFDELVKGR